MLTPAQTAEMVAPGIDVDLWDVTLRTLWVSGSAVAVSTALGVPAGAALALSRFPGRGLLSALVNTGMGLPPVVVGLLTAMMLWRSGPLGSLGLMYTPAAMILAQVIIAFPLVTGVSMAGISALPAELKMQARALGASRIQVAILMLRESRLPVLAGVMAGFGGIISEVGAVMMTGGNIPGQTRVLTTAILQQTQMGRFEAAVALAVVLLTMSFTVNFWLTRLQQRNARNT